MLEDFMRELFPMEMQRVEEGKCPFCGKIIDVSKEFRDELSLKEYHISGLCQMCQDEVFQDE